MRVAISNIAWDVTEDDSVAKLLSDYHIDAIDIAPGKYFPNIFNATVADIQQVKQWWRHRGIEITGMQALLFGTQGLNLFGPPSVQADMLKHLTAICQLAAELSAPRLVFGSPKNRDRSGLTDAQTEETALHFFYQLGKIAENHGVTICLEPNPACYHCNFMTTMPETAHIVRQLALPNIKMQLDTGALTINQENPEMIDQYVDIIGHIHASEPNLIPLGDGTTQHPDIAAMLFKYRPHALITIEMLATSQEPHLIAIKRALETAHLHYRMRDNKMA